MATTTVTPTLHTTQAVYPAEPDVSSLGHQVAAEPGHTRPLTRKERRRQHSQDTASGSSNSESTDSEDDSWTRWEGVRFSLAQGLGPGVRLCSDYFEVAGQLWRLEVYPAGVSVEAASHLSLFLTTPGSSVSSNQVLHKIAIVDQSSAVTHASQQSHQQQGVEPVGGGSKGAHAYVMPKPSSTADQGSLSPSESGQGHHITKTRSRVHGPLLASRGIVAAYPKAVKLNHLMSHAKHYLLHDTLLVRATVQIVRSWSYDVPPAVMYQPEQYEQMHQPSMMASGVRAHDRPDMQQW